MGAKGPRIDVFLKAVTTARQRRAMLPVFGGISVSIRTTWSMGGIWAGLPGCQVVFSKDCRFKGDTQQGQWPKRLVEIGLRSLHHDRVSSTGSLQGDDPARLGHFSRELAGGKRGLDRGLCGRCWEVRHRPLLFLSRNVGGQFANESPRYLGHLSIVVMNEEPVS